MQTWPFTWTPPAPSAGFNLRYTSPAEFRAIQQAARMAALNTLVVRHAQ